MFSIKDEGVILERTQEEFENQAVLNPACIEKDGITHMFYRAVRQGNYSTIGYCQIKDDKVIYRSSKPVLIPEFDYERHGIEDPRIVFHDGQYYLFYTAYDGVNALIAYATSFDLLHFTKQGTISPRIKYNSITDFFRGLKHEEKYLLYAAGASSAGEDVLMWNKNAFIFPQKINGKFAMIHRIKPGIQIIYFKNFADLTDEYWLEYLKELDSHTIFHPEEPFEYMGGGCPPIETPYGWLFIYHGVSEHDDKRSYHAGAALLDLKDPTKVIGRLQKPLFSPTQEWEKVGDVNNVVFPTGAVLKNGRIYIYYGAADSRIAVKSIDVESLIKELQS